MERYLLLLILGLAVGVLGTLVGAGGGFILAPVLLLAYPGENADTLTGISLCVVFFNALSGTRAYAKMRRIDYRAGLLFAFAGAPFAVAGAMFTDRMPRSTFNLVAGLLLIAGSVMLLWRRRGPNLSHLEAAAEHRLPPVEPHPRSNSTLGMLISAGVGFLSSLLGIGGGIIHVPLMIRVLRFPVHKATATSHFVLAIVALAGLLTHVASGAFHHGFRRAAVLSIGAFLGAPVGARLSTRLPAMLILRLLAVALTIAGVRIALLAW